MSGKVLRIGLIGFGAIGKVHACACANLPYYYDMQGVRAQITQVCTAHEETAQRAAETIGGNAVAVSDYREITENPDIDAVDIATPNALHFDALMSAIRHNKHIYCEKPLVATVEEANAVEKCLADYTGTSRVVLQYRFSPAVIRAKQLIDEGRLGTILEFRGHFLHAGSSRPDTVIKPWKLEGGVIADLGSHTLDVLRFLLGDFDSLAATRRTAYPTRPDGKGGIVPVPTEDNMMVLLRFKGEKKQFVFNAAYAVEFFAIVIAGTLLGGLNGFVWAIVLANALRFVAAILWGFLNKKKKDETAVA